MKLISRIIAVLFVLLLNKQAYATECESVYQEVNEENQKRNIQTKYNGSDIILTGKVTGTTINKSPNIANCYAIITPDKILKGENSKKLLVVTQYSRDQSLNDGKCNIPGWVEKDKEYLFYISQNRENNYYFPFCSLKNYVPVSEATKEIKLIKSMSEK